MSRMRAPVRSESDAFRLTWLAALIAVVAALIGWATVPVAGIAAFALALAAVGAGYLRAPDPRPRRPLREAAHAPHARRTSARGRHVLVVANEALAGSELRDRIAGSDGDAVAVDVLAPVLTSRVHLGVTDIDRETREARERLRRSLAWARSERIRARGRVGNTSPEQSIEDELRTFGADEVIVVTHPRDRATWQERGELERLRDELELPVTHVVVGSSDG
jgi:hypothetical protein